MSTTSARPGILERLAGFAHRRRWTALLLWLVILVGVQGASSLTGSDWRNDFSLPGTESQESTDLLAEHGSAQAGDTLDIVLATEPDTPALTESETERRVEAMLAEVVRLPKVAAVVSPYEQPRQTISQDGSVGYATVVLDVPSEQMPVPDIERIHETATEVDGQGLRAELGGEAARLLAAEEGGAAEGIGIMAALVILVLMFGTVIAAGLPVLVAIFAVGSAIGLIVLASHLFTIADYTPYVMTLVGLGVGIDYALLIFARYRAELVAGHEPERATRAALDAAGRTVFFSGCIVIVALLGLVALGIGALQGMALAVACTVLVTMLASLTLLPSLLAIFGERFARQFRARAEKRAAKGRPPAGAVWRRWGGLVQRNPVVALVVAVAALGALAAPALGMRLGFNDAGNDPAGSTSREAYDLLSRGFGPGFNGPLIVVAHGGEDGSGGDPAGGSDGGSNSGSGGDPAGGTVQAAEAARSALADTPGVARTTPPIPTRDGEVATVIVFPESAPQAEATSELVRDLRGELLPRLTSETGAEFLVGGATAALEDFSETVAERMPLFVAIVVGVSMLLLMIVFRSVLIPLKAAVLNLLSIGAALGAMTLVFQDGRLGVEPGPIEAFLPVMVFAIVFGLSMDYEIFLVSRIHEEWRRTGDHALAVREGLGHTGAVITAAGAIMIVVFGAFVLSGERMLQQMGFGMAVAIFVDAVVIRCLIVPAAMQLMGRHAWWLPAPLARLVPTVELERHGAPTAR
ncbi:MMPL family transporter [Streptomyces sp. 4N509B]|uniref:MMPL family transporter n=1 Tax=Streptomyces sp. 4N509B TaxID=3457413 RepID=UPI003FD00608